MLNNEYYDNHKIIKIDKILILNKEYCDIHKKNQNWQKFFKKKTIQIQIQFTKVPVL